MSEAIIDDLNRTAKLFIDSGAAASVDEAVAKLGTFTMHLTIDAGSAASPTYQAALLTALNCGLRSLLGGVTVDGALDAPLVIPVTGGATLGDAVIELGGVIAPCPLNAPLVVIGGEATADPAKFAIRTTCDGWRGGIVPLTDVGLTMRTEFTVSGALAGALAVAEVFAHLNGEAMAGHRSVGLSLWQLDPDSSWLLPHDDEPMIVDLPSDFWLIGLGHLGQAYLWAIGLLPYADPGDVRLFLQDVDRAGKSTKSTSLLTRATDERRLKTRICSDWAEQRGFDTAIIERRFDDDFRRSANEPGLALCGVDNPDARRILDEAGFAMVLEAGLGNGAEDFRLIRVHSFPAVKRSAEIWPAVAQAGNADDRIDRAATLKGRPAYVDLRDKGDIDECGLTRLADVAVGAPFVGVTAAAIVVAQAVRAVTGGPRVTVANVDLRSIDYRSALTAPEPDLITFATAKARMP
ncbi:hypothetical protein [Sphingomonas sp. G-3-2-10]|uniref:hypothetical protein n=1 Tax=Sphingomonas sp. G-3-2-10 TaxID=2728838 RepID=UPI00146E4DD4|nr:hypothetical protein [Sphingomonas sp. G-3-2-10]NML05952.1 hypothetical protein [Sphingomonas sp. G-3-2-10]